MATAETRRLAAIMFTDIVGFSRQMGADEARMLRRLEAHNHLIQQAVAEHHGQVIKSTGDGFLLEFPSVVHAVQCAQSIQAQFRAHNADKETNEQIHVRIGIHLGDIVQRDRDVFGDGVNIASRLQTLAESDTICISQVVYQEVAKKLSLGPVVSLGRPKLKNIAERFQVYALLSEKPKGFRQTLWVQRLKLSRRVGTTVFVLVSVLLLGGIVIFLYPSLPTLITQHSLLGTQEAQPPLLPLPDKPSIAVLPFVNISGDPEQEYFSDGMTEDLITDLSKISDLFVIARNSVFFYKGKTVRVQDVSKELGVRYVLEGSVRRSDRQVRITAQLVDATTGHHLWAERYDRPLQDIFALQDEITQKIVFALKVKLTKEEQERFKRAPTDNLEAYDYFSHGLAYYLRTTKETNAQARQMYEKAIALDPKYAAAYVGLSGTYFREWFFHWSPDPQPLERAFELAQRAIALDDSLPPAHVVVGRVYQFKKQHERAVAELERAITLDPNFAFGYSDLGITLNFAGRPEEAIGLLKKAMRLDPHYPVPWLFHLGHAYRLTGRFEEAITAQKEVLAQNPEFWNAHAELAIIYSELDREEEARAEAAAILRLSPNFSVEMWRQRTPYKDPAVLEQGVAALRKAGLK